MACPKPPLSPKSRQRMTVPPFRKANADCHSGCALSYQSQAIPMGRAARLSTTASHRRELAGIVQRRSRQSLLAPVILSGGAHGGKEPGHRYAAVGSVSIAPTDCSLFALSPTRWPGSGGQWAAGSPRDGAAPPGFPAGSQTPETSARPAQPVAVSLEQLW